MINDFQVKSSRRLHFEDLEPSMFEMMVLEILDISGMYNDIRHYGKKVLIRALISIVQKRIVA